MPKVKCVVCAKEICRSQYKIETYKVHCCSWDCRREYLRQQTQKSIVCKNCGENFIGYKRSDKRSKTTNKFCSQSCAASYNNKKVKRKYYHKHICLNCNKEIVDARRSSTTRNFCNHRCQHEYQNKVKVEQWLKGEISGLRNEKINPTVCGFVRRWLYENRGEKCEDCGWAKINPYTGVIPLDVHHIDGNALNNIPDNLKVLCKSCHSLTSSYGGSNRGNGRKNRKYITSEQRKNFNND